MKATERIHKTRLAALLLCLMLALSLALPATAYAREHEQLVAEAVGIQADTVKSGEEALRMIREKQEEGQPYQLVLTDYVMPGMDGIAFTEALRRLDGGETAVILLTGYSWEDKMEEAVRAGVDEFVSKPLFKDSLIHSVQTILLKREKAAEGEAGKDQAGTEGQSAHKLEGLRILVVEDMELNAEILMDLLEMEDMQSEHDEDVQTSLQAGMDAHLSKPVEPEKLYQTLSRIIRGA